MLDLIKNKILAGARFFMAKLIGRICVWFTSSVSRVVCILVRLCHVVCISRLHSVKM